MTEMVERVARALFLAEHPGSDWSAGRARMKWFALAEAAIEAMREATPSMVYESYRTEIHGPPSHLKVWHAMIDAALTNTP